MPVSISTSIIDSNEDSGAAIHTDGGDVTLEDVTVTNNAGGGLVCRNDGGFLSPLSSYIISGNGIDIDCGTCSACLCAPTPLFNLDSNDGSGVCIDDTLHWS